MTPMHPDDMPPDDIPFTPVVLPQLMDFQVVYGRVQADSGKQLVSVTYFTVHGQFVFLMDAEAAVMTGEGLVTEGRAASSGLWTP